MKKTLINIILLSAIVLTLAAACGGTASKPPAENAPTVAAPAAALDGKALLQERCTVCHDLSRVESKKKTAGDWKTTVDRMVGKGAKLTAEEQKALIDYLTATYGQ